MTPNPDKAPEDFAFPDCGAQAAREAREEIEGSALMTMVEQLRSNAKQVWNAVCKREDAKMRNTTRRYLDGSYSAEELFARLVLDATDDLIERSIDIICETKAQEERRAAE